MNAREDAPAWVQRIAEERTDLLERIAKIRAFDTSQISDTQRHLLTAQEATMVSYAAILQQRLSQWERENPEKPQE